MKRLLFVINPISGGKSKTDVVKQIEQFLDVSKFSYEFFWWEKVEGLKDAITPFVAENGYAVVAVGGDGTINEVASLLVNTSTRLAIIPMGSGNGLARELKIPRNIEGGLKVINEQFEQAIDIGYANDDVFVNVAGIGFDALVCQSFAQIEKRGFASYVKAIFSDFGKTGNLEFTLNTDGQLISKRAFMLSIANGTQWGNNFYVSPDASYTDGILDFVFVGKPKVYQVPWFLLCLYLRMNHSLLTTIKIKEAIISLPKPIYYHTDGEPKYKIAKMKVSVQKQGLTVLTPKSEI